MRIRYSLVDANGKEHELIVRNFEEACNEVLKKYKLRIRQRQITQPNEPSLF
jgi:hypothetical protein